MRDVVHNRRVLLLAGPAALVLATAVACSSSASPSTSSTATTTTTTTATSGATTTTSAAAAALAVTTNSSLGQIVTTGAGRTVYRYDADSSNPSKSNCTGTCASLWPPVVVTGNGRPAVTGISSSMLGEITRSDGGKQLTLDGWPLYTYAGDTAAGTADGQGSGGTWWAVTPTGAKAKTGGGSSAGSTSTGTGMGGGNY
jgi:predicted lipoprotein with Yx(FWY)xxD motif